MNIPQTLAAELQVRPAQVEAVLSLMADGATVPFIARYRKEATGGLDDSQLRTLEQRNQYLTELEDRRQTIIASIDEQKKLTPELAKAINEADTKTILEDLYLPYKPKRRTKAQVAREAGLEELADAILQNRQTAPEELAKKYLNEEHKINSADDALLGARHILIERWSEDASLVDDLRQLFSKHAEISSKETKEKTAESEKFKDYFEFSEAISKIPSHRILALLRGRTQNSLSLSIDFSDPSYTEQAQQKIAKLSDFINEDLAADAWITKAIEWTWKVKLHLKLELEAFKNLKEHADNEAIEVFQGNLKHLLMAAPAGKFVVLGLDPGFRTGVKTVVVDDTGKLLAHEVIYPHQPQQQWDKSLAMLSSLCKKFNVRLVSIGNGTASRETEQLVAELQKKQPELKLQKITVSEAGASVYSASELAAKEFPDLDVSYRGAVSIARRLQDPLAELVKIDPKAIGVGQYQHDVNQVQLSKTLVNTMEDCVNAVGADLNTASAPLLECISGLNKTLAKQVVSYREKNGRFDNRKQLLDIPRLGEKAYQQCAGFLRIYDGSEPLDSSSVHPESYDIVNKMLTDISLDIKSTMGDSNAIKKINASKYVGGEIGLPTINDIISELQKPGRDPRPSFKTAKFDDKIQKVTDLKPGLKLEGVVTNVANFGAFVDIGVHQDGLVHVSQLADHYVEDIHKEVQVGKIVQVTVLEVDIARKRISLSMKSTTESRPTTTKTQHKNRQNNGIKNNKNNSATSGFGSQLLSALKNK